MTLKNLISDLKQVTERDNSKYDYSELVEGRVILPSDFKDSKVEFTNENSVDCGGLPKYQLLLSTFREGSFDEVQPLVSELFSRTSLNSPILLPLQDYVCGEMGITFR